MAQSDFITHKQNPLVTENLSWFFNNTRKQVINLRGYQKDHGTFGTVRAQEEIADLVNRELNNQRTSIIGDLATYRIGSRNVLKKLVAEREGLMENFLDDQGRTPYQKKRYITIRYNLPTGQVITKKNIKLFEDPARAYQVQEDDIERYGEETILSFIDKYPEIALPERLLHDKEMWPGTLVTLALNRLDFEYKGITVLQLFDRGKLASERNIEKKCLYLFGDTDMGNDDAASMLVAKYPGDWYNAIRAQIRALSGQKDAIDIKGDLPDGTELPLEFNRSKILAAMEEAKKLNKFYMNNPKMKVRREDKRKMSLIFNFDHKYQSFSVESQYRLMLANEIYQNGCLSRKNYESVREDEFIEDCVKYGVHLVATDIKNNVSDLFLARDLNLGKLL